MAGTGSDGRLPSIFLSYARADDEDGFVRAVHETLTREGFTVWWDMVAMPSRGLTFLHEIAEAIDAADRVLVVLSPTAVHSEYVRAEWQYALAADKVVTPVLRAGDFDLLPPELKGTHCEDVRTTRDAAEARAAIVRLASAPPAPLASAVSVPVPPPHYRPRPDQVARVAARLALAQPEQLAVPPQERTFVVHGMGGIGKSVLAAAVARSTATRRVFKDGVIWIPVGPGAQPLTVLQQMALRLGDDLAKYGTEAAARLQLATRLDRGAVLIVLDNVWDRGPVEPVRDALGARCRLLITAREPGVLELGTPAVNLEPFSPDDALAYLGDRARAAGVESSPAMAEVARECGYLPFALALVGAMIESTGWERLLERLQAADLRFMEAAIPGYPYTDLLRALQVNVDRLRESADPRGRMAIERYFEIAAFRWEAGVPEAAIATVWRARGGLDAAAAEDVLTRLARHGLVRTEGRAPRRLVRLHDLQQDYLWCHVERAREHAAILDAYATLDPASPFVAQDDGYFLEQCFHHLEAAGRATEMHAILDAPTADGTNRWWTTRIAHGQVLGFIADVRRASTDSWRSVAAGRAPDPEQVTRAVRYTLMIGSARSAIGEVPLPLVSRLLAEQLWTADQALALIEWSGHGSGLIDALSAVFPHLPVDRRPQALEDALQQARGQAETQDRTRRLLQLVPLLDGPRRTQVLEEALSLPGADSVHSLCAAARLVPERHDLLDRAIAAARTTGDAFSRKQALLEIAAVLPTDRIEEIVPLVDGAGTPEDQAEVLTVLADQLPDARSREVAIRAFAMLGRVERVTGAEGAAVTHRARLVRLLPADAQPAAARGVIAELERLESNHHPLPAIADVVPFLAGVERTRAEARACEFARHTGPYGIKKFLEAGRRGAWMAAAAPGFFQPLVTALLEAARKAEASYQRVEAIAALLPFVDSARARALLLEEERQSRRLADAEPRTRCTAVLAATLTASAREPVIDSALAASAGGGESSGRTLAALAPVASARQLDAIADALPEVDDFDRGTTAAALFAANADAGRWDQALALLPELDAGYYLTRALERLPEHVPTTVARAIVLGAVKTSNAELSAAAIPPLCRWLPDEERANACQMGLLAADVLRRRDRYGLLEALIPALPREQLDRASALIPDDEEDARMERDGALVSLAVRRGECHDLATAIDTLDRMTFAFARCRACVGLSALAGMPAAITSRLLELAETCADKESGETRVELLAAVARQHTEAQRARLIDKALALARVVERTSFSSAESAQARALTSLVPLLEGSRQADLVIEAWDRAVDSGMDRVSRLEAIAPWVAALAPERIATRWRSQLERASSERHAVLRELELMAPVVAGLGGDAGVLGAIESIATTARWWP